MQKEIFQTRQNENLNIFWKCNTHQNRNSGLLFYNSEKNFRHDLGTNGTILDLQQHDELTVEKDHLKWSKI